MSIPTLPSVSGDFWRRPVVQWSVFALAAALFGFLFGEGVLELVRIWGQREEYSYGYFVPLLTLFLQRGRVLTNEYLVKWFIFQDALVARRTDGAMVRLTTSLRNDETWESGEQRLQRFAAVAMPKLDDYLPR